MVELENVSF